MRSLQLPSHGLTTAGVRSVGNGGDLDHLELNEFSVIYLSVIYQFIHPSICSSIYLFLCLPLSVSLRLSLSLSFRRI